MNLSGHTVLITGGASGIGRAFAERFIKAGSTVIVCGRRESRLQEFKEQFPQAHTRICDVSKESDRVDLFEWAIHKHPDLNILVNNAGIQQRFNILQSDAKTEWSYFSKEIASNIEAPLQLSMLFAPHLAKKEQGAIINVTSGLAFTPMAIAPIYSATKAALHSFTVSLRLQLANTPIQVIEVAPPAVNTDLGGVGLHTFGADVNEFADYIFKGIQEGKLEVGFGSSEKALRMTRDEIDELSASMYERMKKTIE